MKNIFIFMFFFFSAANVLAQKETFELTTYTPPKEWKKNVKADSYTSYTITNKQTKSYCQIFIMLSTKSKGGIKEDFESEWENLVAKQYNVTDTPQTTQPSTAGGWQMKSGMASFSFNNGKSTAMLTTMSGYGKAVSIVTVTNSEGYIPAIQELLQSVVMKKPSTENTIKQQGTQSNNQATGNSKFAFTTTNFDDGWTGTEQEDWVQVTKGKIIVLLHYSNKAADAHNFVLLDGLKNAWDVLVAPRYSSAANMQFKSSGSWESIEFGEADMVQNSTGKRVYVALFKKNFSSGAGKYMEFITPDKKTFEQEFGTYENAAANFGTGSGFDKMANMVTYNKFAVSAVDLNGTWTSNFTGMTQYVNAYTGASAGANTHASNESFVFGTGNTYKWDLGVASGFVGNIKFQSVKSTGRFTVVNNWQVKFSDIEGKPKTYNVQFVCIKGARVLWIGETGFGKKE